MGYIDEYDEIHNRLYAVRALECPGLTAVQVRTGTNKEHVAFSTRKCFAQRFLHALAMLLSLCLLSVVASPLNGEQQPQNTKKKDMGKQSERALSSNPHIITTRAQTK